MSETKKNQIDGSETISITGLTTQRATCWSITINNPTADDIRIWQTATTFPWVKEVVGQIEMGENDTPHIQGLLKTEQVRFSKVKKLLPRAHIEIARNATALAQYVVKEDTRVAEISRIQVATPHLIQTSITNYVMDSLIRDSVPIIYQSHLKIERSQKKPMITWVPRPATMLELHGDGNGKVNLLNLNRSWLQANADTIVDSVVATLIEQGYHTTEFVMSNLQVRTAYKKYLTSICIRNVLQEASQARIPSKVKEDGSSSQDVD